MDYPMSAAGKYFLVYTIILFTICILKHHEKYENERSIYNSKQKSVK